MEQQYLFEPIPCDKYDLLTKEDFIALYEGTEDLLKQALKYNEELKKELLRKEQKHFFIAEQLITVKNMLFGKSSEKSPKSSKAAKNNKKSGKKKVKLPSERYPNLSVIEKKVELDQLPSCQCCGNEMSDSGLTEDSEYLHVIPKKYYIVKQKRTKYRCSKCHGSLVTTPAIPRIKAGSSFSDEMVIDASCSKYCDLIPMERYTQIAARDGVVGIPANSLIQASHNLADYLLDINESIKSEVLSSKVIHADETPHKMLEGDKKSNWYLWGFSTNKAAYFEAHDTRSGQVASNILIDSNCEFLISDVFSGYARAVTDANVIKKDKAEIIINNVYCNAHARRKFKESEKNYVDESRLFLYCYRKIYYLEKRIKSDDINFDFARRWQRIYFQAMDKYSPTIEKSYSNKSSIVKAINYFVKNYRELTLFLDYRDIPIDNNSQERLMRSPVIGRKTWFGTHSRRGAKTNSVMFTIVESCKLNKVNPREYIKDQVNNIHQDKEILTPYNYKLLLEKSSVSDPVE